MGFGMAVACIDETIQIFTPERASSLIDVWIDTSGFALGLVVIFLAYTIYNKIKGEN
jgi:VanZ family protein